MNELDVSALYAALDRQRQARSLTWHQLANWLGISPSTFTSLEHGNKPDADTLLTLAAWLGGSADTFASGRSPVPGNAADAEPVAAITSYLRSSQKLTPQQAEALSKIIAAAYEAIVGPKAA